MPRIPPSLVKQANSINKLLAPLLPVCRDLRSARNELRWLKQHALETGPLSPFANNNTLLETYVRRRARGEPLQYILGSEFFGDLEIKCRPGVLIPRPDTAAYVINLVRLLSKNEEKFDFPRKLGVLDLCTGSGCIPLLFHHEFFSAAANDAVELDLVGVDISPRALALARDNLAAQIKGETASDSSNTVRTQSLRSMSIIQANVLQGNGHSDSMDVPPVLDALKPLWKTPSMPKYDVLISNPPYISSKAFGTTTARSVRTFEPKLALVPQGQARSDSEDGDEFYPRLLQISEQVDAKIVLLEVADLDQAKRVAARAVSRKKWDRVEIWRDEPSDQASEAETILIDGEVVKIRGSGNGRSVFACRGAAVGWIGD